MRWVMGTAGELEHVHEVEWLSEVLLRLHRNRQVSSWAVLLVAFRDDPEKLPARGVYERLFTSAGAGTMNMVEFFADMSHGLLDLSGSAVFGWYRLDVKRSTYVGNVYPQPAGKLNRNGLADAARAAATAAKVDLSKFAGVVVVGYGGTDLCGWVGGMQALCDDNSLQPSLLGQEMGHGYGLDHARADGSIDDYNDPWDVMSTAAFPWMQAPDPDYTSIGPGLNAWNMRSRGWLDETRVVTVAVGSNVQVKLRPLHHHDLPGTLAAEVGEYLIEFRVPERWDAAIGNACVLVHRFDAWENRSYLMTGTGGQQALLEGDVFETGGPYNLTPTIRVEVLEIDAAGHTARLGVQASAGWRPPMLVGTDLFGTIGIDGGGWLLVGGKIVKIPPRGPITSILEDVARLLATEPGIDVSATNQLRSTLARRIVAAGLELDASIETTTHHPPGYEGPRRRGGHR